MFDISLFIERLKELTETAGLNATALAKKLGTTKATVSRYMSGKRVPSLRMFVHIADYFGVTSDFLLGRENESYDIVFKSCPPFGERLNFLLGKYGFTKYAFCRQAHFNEDTVYGWLKGKYEPEIESICRIADFLGCTADYVIGRE